jgi:hypothetical protein
MSQTLSSKSPKTPKSIPSSVVRLALALAVVIAATPPAGAVVSASRSSAADAHDALDDQSAQPLRIEMRNVRLHVDSSAVMRVVALRGEAVAATPGAVPVLDDARSFAIVASGGTVALDGEALGALLNEIVFGYRGAPLRHIRVRIQDGGIVQSGILRKGVDLKFTMAASLTLQPDGKLLVHPTSLRILGVNGEKLLRALGLHLKDMLDLKGARGIAFAGKDDMVLDPLAILPPPAVRGTIADVRADGAAGTITLDFARTPADSAFARYVRPDSTVPNYVYFRGGRLRFGRLEMRDTDLLITDGNASDPFDLYLAHYAEQLSAGYSRTMPNAALRVVMPDFRALAQGAPGTPPPRLPGDH